MPRTRAARLTRTVSFYRFAVIPGGGSVWLRVAEYEVRAAAGDDPVFDSARERFEREHGLRSWTDAADTYLIR